MTTFDNPYASPPEVKDYFGTAQSTDVLATRTERFAGAFVDGIVQAILVVPASFAFFFILMMVITIEDENSLGFELLTSVLGFFIGAGTFILLNGYLLATRGQTLGKVLLKTKIVSESGEQLPINHLLLKRYLPIWVLTSLPWIGGVFGLVNAVAIFRDNRKCFHDDFAGTKVIKLPS